MGEGRLLARHLARHATMHYERAMPEVASGPLGLALSTFASLFVAVDPFAAVPLFLVMTKSDTPASRKATALRAALATFCLLCSFAAVGPRLLAALGISLSAFRIAGGLLLFSLSLDMLRARPSRTRTSPEEEAEGVHKEDVSIFPLAIPMLAGPGAASTVMVLAARGVSVLDFILLGLSIGLTTLACYLMLRSAPWIGDKLGQTGANVIERVLGLILAATAVQFVLDGLAAVHMAKAS
jgi:multiple antibiotic resistance protein